MLVCGNVYSIVMLYFDLVPCTCACGHPFVHAFLYGWCHEPCWSLEHTVLQYRVVTSEFSSPIDVCDIYTLTVSSLAVIQKIIYSHAVKYIWLGAFEISNHSDYNVMMIYDNSHDIKFVT